MKNDYIEEWKPVVGYEGYYEVSNLGRVYAIPRQYIGGYNALCNTGGKMMQIDTNRKRGDRRSVILCKGGLKSPTQYVSVLVANAFIPNPNDKPEVDHILPIKDGGGDEVFNLRWVDRKENMDNESTRKRMELFWNDSERNRKISERMKENNPTLNMTAEWKSNISRSHKGKPNTKCRKKVRQLTLDGRIVNEYDSLTIAAQSVGTRCGDISSAINGRQKTAKGYRWEYC